MKDSRKSIRFFITFTLLVTMVLTMFTGCSGNAEAEATQTIDRFFSTLKEGDFDSMMTVAKLSSGEEESFRNLCDTEQYTTSLFTVLGIDPNDVDADSMKILAQGIHDCRKELVRSYTITDMKTDFLGRTATVEVTVETLDNTKGSSYDMEKDLKVMINGYLAMDRVKLERIYNSSGEYGVMLYLINDNPERFADNFRKHFEGIDSKQVKYRFILEKEDGTFIIRSGNEIK